MIYKNFQPWHFAFTRIVIFGVLALDLAIDDIASLSAFPPEAFVPHGVLRACPEQIARACASADTLTTFKWVSLVVLICGILGAGPSRLVVSLSLIASILFYGAARGHGGHVNHQELIPLHALFFLLFGNSFAVWSVNSLFGKRTASPWRSTPDLVLQQFLVRAICFFILFTYWIIGVARVETSGVSIYFTNSMHCWVLQNSCKWNWWPMELGAGINNMPFVSSLLQWLFPAATVLELASTLALFFRRFTIPIVCSLVLFHVSIFLLMNIFFWQNLVLLSLLVAGWYADRAAKQKLVARGQAIVFYDSECGMCDRFIAGLARADRHGALSFAPLGGTTARSLGVDPQGPRRSWSLVLVHGDQKRHRSDGMLEALKIAGAFPELVDFCLAIPRPIRDSVYSIVASIRGLIPARNKICALPAAAQVHDRFLP